MDVVIAVQRSTATVNQKGEDNLWEYWDVACTPFEVKLRKIHMTCLKIHRWDLEEKKNLSDNNPLSTICQCPKQGRIRLHTPLWTATLCCKCVKKKMNQIYQNHTEIWSQTTGLAYIAPADVNPELQIRSKAVTLNLHSRFSWSGVSGGFHSSHFNQVLPETPSKCNQVVGRTEQQQYFVSSGLGLTIAATEDVCSISYHNSPSIDPEKSSVFFIRDAATDDTSRGRCQV